MPLSAASRSRPRSRRWRRRPTRPSARAGEDQVGAGAPRTMAPLSAGGGAGRRRVLLAMAVLAGLGCDTPQPVDPIKIGLLLSYSGPLAANSVNAERALLMAIDAANAAGGVGGRAIQLVARDTGTSPLVAR